MKSMNVLLCLMSIFFVLAISAWAAEPDRDPFYTKGNALADGPEGNGIFEEVDPFSGNLKIVQTDFDLPQKGGLSLKIMRYYDSAIWGKVNTSVSSVVVDKFKSPLGIGWNLHMGMLLAANSANPVMILPDGSQHAFYDVNYGDPDYGYKKISRGLAILNYPRQIQSPLQYEVILPDGTIYTFAALGSTTYDSFNDLAQLIKIENSSRTSSINVYYRQTNNNNYKSFYLIDYIVDSVGRNIQFEYNDYAPFYQLDSISVDNRTVSYICTYLNTPLNRPYKLLTNVQPPTGNSWSYNYEYIPGGSNPGGGPDNHLGLKRINYPTGGTIDYTYKVQYFDVGAIDVQFRVIDSRTTAGRDVVGGTWTYAYESAWSNGVGQWARPNKTTVTAPNNRKEIYTYYGWDNCGHGDVWKVGLPISREIYSGATPIETTQYEWVKGTSISGYSYKSAEWFNLFIMDANNVWLPFKKKQTITRGTNTYVTTYNSHDDYGNPTSINEVGDNGKVRNTTLTYWTNSGKNIVIGKPATKTLTGSFPGTSSESYLYNSDGTLKKQTLNGVVTDFTYHQTADYILNGDLKTIKDANGNITTYEWNYGRISKVINPIYTVSRSINPDGTVASETNGRGFATTYLYDKLLRLTKITPPAGNVTNVTYPSDSSYRQEQRGSFWTKQLFDGFGRDRGATDSKGVVTTVAYKANGLKEYASSNIGDKVSFDDLQRPIQYLHLDNKFVQQSYAGNTVTVTDELLRPTVLTYQSFGNPDEKFLASIKDARNNITSYDYNILGKLTKITAGALVRTFGYDGKFFLTSESNPETGSITYGRDLVGNLASVTDGSGTTIYVYDAINRLDYITKAGKTIDYTFDNADNRTGLNAPGANLTFTYDAANRLKSKAEQLSGVSGTFTMSFDYDANDNLEYITYPSGRKIQNLYNANNQVVSVKDVTDPNYPRIYVSGITYNTASQPVNGYTLGNGLTPNHTYTSRFFPKNIAAGSAVNLTYAYFDTGNVSGITNHLNGTKSQSFNYDELNRLTIFNGAWGNGSFNYDRHGNRLSKSVGGQATNYVINAGTYRLDNSTGAEQSVYYYNAIGQVSSSTYEGKGYVYTFDTFNNLETITFPPYTFGQYTYDGDGMRITKASDTKLTLYHYDNDGALLTENVTDGSLTRDYIYLNGKLLARVDNDTLFTGTMIGTFRNGSWYLDANGSGSWDVSFDRGYASFGMAGDIPVTGDWNGDGVTDFGTFRIKADGLGYWYLDMNGNHTWEPGVDKTIQFGMANDTPVTGYWNHDGITDIGVFRNVGGTGTWYFDSNGSWGWESGIDSVLTFGLGTDIPVTGDWNHDGTTDIGAVRGTTWYLDANGNRQWNPGVDLTITFGQSGDKPVTGDWNNDGTTEIGVFRAGAWYIGTLAGAIDKTIPNFGLPTDLPFTGRW